MSTSGNRWSVYRDTLLQWSAQVPLRSDAPGDLVDWTKQIIALAQELGIAEFRASQQVPWWSREELFARIDRRLTEERVVDAFQFASGFKRTRSTLALYSSTGIVERPVKDVGALLRALRGPIADELEGAVRSCAPMWWAGHAIDYKSDATLLSAFRLLTTSVTFGIDTDIWLPWSAANSIRGRRRSMTIASSQRAIPRA